MLAWYDEILGKIAGGAVVGRGERERLVEEEAADIRHLLDLARRAPRAG